MSARSSALKIESVFGKSDIPSARDMLDIPPARSGRKGKLKSSTPSSTAKAIHSKLPLYHKHQSLCPQVTFMQTALAGAICPHPSADGGAGKIEDTKRNTAQMELKALHLPGDVLREAVMAQYADCEATCYHILTVIEKNTTSASRFKFFKKCCLDLSGEEGHPEERSILMDTAWRDASALGAMQKEFKDAEEVAISLGVFGDAKESCGFYFGVADSSDAKESSWSSSGIPHLSKSVTSDPEAPSTSDLEVPYTSNSKIPYTSNSKIPFPTEDSSDIECCFVMRNNQGRKSMKKPSKGSGLNPCLQPDMSQLGIPSEFTHDPTQIPESAMSAFQEELNYYNCEMTSGVTLFVASDNEFLSSIVQVHLLSATNYVPTAFMGDFIPP
ncbi:hypothetical protein EV401DRAFT_2072038 [Pisolithus croceorrhizus]|nr:hypothetical protein EV401DRAFT_2072038 [Pisolithus croceorrhizus]